MNFMSVNFLSVLGMESHPGCFPDYKFTSIFRKGLFMSQERWYCWECSFRWYGPAVARCPCCQSLSFDQLSKVVQIQRDYSLSNEQEPLHFRTQDHDADARIPESRHTHKLIDKHFQDMPSDVLLDI